MSGIGSAGANAVILVSCPPGTEVPDQADRVLIPAVGDASGRIVVAGGGSSGSVDVGDDDIPTPAPADTAPVGAFGLGFNEDTASWARFRVREIVEGAGWPALTQAVQALGLCYDTALDDFFYLRGRGGVLDVRQAPQLTTTPVNLASSFADLAAGEFRRLVAAGTLTITQLTFSSTSSTRWFQVWDLASTAAVPTSRTVGSRPIVQVALGVGAASPPMIPAGGLRTTNGIVIVASTVPDFYSAPAAGDQDDLAFGLQYGPTYTP